MAVDWWADKLRSCKQSGLSAEERCDITNVGYQMSEMLISTLKPKVTEEQVAAFKSALTASLKKEIPRFLGVDYSPDVILTNALKVAKIEVTLGTLPIKTGMWLTNGKVDVGYGYGAPIETIYPVKKGNK